MKSEIIEKISEIEKRLQIKVLYACESGSRAWGFPSPNSDFDVRCIYVHPLSWYVSVLSKTDHLEEPISGDLDISGWDLRKTLGLINKSNSVVWEWLQSPTVYLECEDFSKTLLRVARPFFSPLTGFHHYFSMAKRGIEERGDSSKFKIKKYFYILRPLLAASWICKKVTVPPMVLHDLLNLGMVSSDERQAVTNLVLQKVNLNEGHEIDRVQEIENLILKLTTLCDAKKEELFAHKGEISDLDQFLRSWVR